MAELTDKEIKAIEKEGKILHEIRQHLLSLKLPDTEIKSIMNKFNSIFEKLHNGIHNRIESNRLNNSISISDSNIDSILY
jgi:flagellar biosynthesis/type III secretory pathway chaperone